MASPGRSNIGGGAGQSWIGDDGFGVSGKSPRATCTLPILIGNIHFQQISVMGLTQRPSQVGSAALAPAVAKRPAVSKEITVLFSFILSIPLQ